MVVTNLGNVGIGATEPEGKLHLIKYNPKIRESRNLPDIIDLICKVSTMKKLKLPIIKGPIPDAKRLSMDDYLKFVNFHLKYTCDKKTNRIWKKMLDVNVPFSLK